MNAFLAAFTIFFCLTFIGVKNQVDLGQTKDSMGLVWDANDIETDPDEKFELLQIPIIHQFISLAINNYVSTQIIPVFFSSNFIPKFNSDVSSRGPPRA